MLPRLTLTHTRPLHFPPGTPLAPQTQPQESLCGASGFVTFKASRDAEMALRLRLEPEGPSR